MQVMFLWDTHGGQDETMGRQAVADATNEGVLRKQAIEAAKGAWEQREAADRWMERIAPQWPVHRQPIVDRNLLRLAIWELIGTQTPPKVVIDEAIELAKEFSTEQSAAFVNGVLDAILKEHQAITTGAPLPVDNIVNLEPGQPAEGTEAQRHEGT